METVQPIRSKKKIEAMKMYLKGRGPRNYCLFVLGINSGLRVGDLLRLTIGDITGAHGKVADRIRLREGKTGKIKDLALSDSSRKAVSEYLMMRKSAKEEEPLFLSEKGGPISRQHAWRILSEAAQHVGITEPIGTHTLRKTFGYHAYKQTGDVALVQSILNHSAPSITLRYIGITQDQMDDVHLSLNL